MRAGDGLKWTSQTLLDLFSKFPKDVGTLYKFVYFTHADNIRARSDGPGCTYAECKTPNPPSYTFSAGFSDPPLPSPCVRTF